MKKLAVALSLLSIAGLPWSLHAAESKPAPKTMAVPVVPADKDAGFKTIFDGKTLEGWNYDPASWRLENGIMVGERKTPLLKLEPGTVFAPFIVWKGTVRDFELKLEYRVSDEGDSGVFYRVLPHPSVKGSLADLYGGPGYQDPIEGNRRIQPGPNDAVMDKSSPGWSKTRRWGGGNYDSNKRQFLALPGQLTQAEAGAAVRIDGTLDNATKIDEILGEGWSEVHIIARGNILIHIRNGHVTSVVIDNDAQKRSLEGTIALDLHPGPPMKVEFRNIRLKTLVP